MTGVEILLCLEGLERDRNTFNHPDELLSQFVELEGERLTDAAKMLGREWNGMYSRAHVLLIARAYHLAAVRTLDGTTSTNNQRERKS